MKANELMIGDWMYYSHTEDGIAPYKEVICIKAEDLCRNACIIEAHYEPITLTAEILEKNGWEYRNDSVFVFADDYYDIIIYEWSDSIYRVNISYNEMNTPSCTMVISFIHELQHALRLCGIEKEIML